MRIYVGHSGQFDYESELYDVLEQAVFERPVSFVFPYRDLAIVQDSRAAIRSCDLLLAEVSRPSTGLGIEMGWADTAGIRIVAVHKDGTKPTNAIRAVTNKIHTYADTDDLINVVTQMIGEMR